MLTLLLSSILALQAATAQPRGGAGEDARPQVVDPGQLFDFEMALFNQITDEDVFESTQDRDMSLSLAANFLDLQSLFREDTTPTDEEGETVDKALQAAICFYKNALDKSTTLPETQVDILKEDVEGTRNAINAINSNFSAFINRQEPSEEFGDCDIEIDDGSFEIDGPVFFKPGEPQAFNFEIAQAGSFDVSFVGAFPGQAATTQQTFSAQDSSGTTGSISLTVNESTRVRIRFQPADGSAPKEKMIDLRANVARNGVRLRF